jgi:hypothetical protein
MEYYFGFVSHEERLAVEEVVYVEGVVFTGDVCELPLCVVFVYGYNLEVGGWSEGYGVGVGDLYLFALEPECELGYEFSLLVVEGELVADRGEGVFDNDGAFADNGAGGETVSF